MSEYSRKTGDAKWFQTTIGILREAIKETEAESAAEPQKNMRSVEGTDSAGLRPENCRR